MTVSGKVSDRGWSVAAEVKPVAGGFVCVIHVDHSDPKGKFEHQFKHSKVFETEREAVLDCLQEGMGWIELKMANVIDF